MLPTFNQALLTVETTLKALPGMAELVFYAESHKKTGKYIVWAEDGQDGDSFVADNVAALQTITGTVDLYTQTEHDPMVSRIQKAMTESQIDWELNSVQHETETGYHHYEWVWSMGVDPNGTDDV